MPHKGSGQVVPATMKAGDRKVYVIDGDVVQYADKSGIDVAKSDKSIVVCDAETGKYEYTSPDQLMNVGEPADPSTLSEAYMANERAKEAAANGEGTAEGNAAAESNAAANGDVSSDGGKAEVVEPAYTDGSRVEINGHEYDVKSAGEKTVVLVDEHGKELAWTRSALDAKLESGDAEVLEPKAEAAPDVATEGLKAGDVFEDSDGNALTVKRVDGDKVVAVGADGKGHTYEDGTFEQMVESGVLKRKTTDLNAAQTGSPEGDGVPAFGVGSVIELEGHEYKLLRVDKEDDTVYLENVEGETALWSYSGICIAFNEGDARLIDNKNYVLTDNQGNPVNEDGTLKVEEVKSVDELTDEDFSAPTRNVQLPALPQNVDAAIGANGKPVIIKKNIFEKNWNAHRFPFEESRAILNAALYNTDLVGQTQPNNKPLHWVAIKIDDKSPIVVLEVNENKDNIEIVGWYTLDERNLNRIKRQAEKNGGELVMLSPKDKVESLSTPQTDLSSESKGTEQSSSVQVDVSENAPMPMRVVGKGKNAVQEEDWLATTPKRGHDYVFKESGLDAEEANAFVENKVAEAEKNLEKVKGKAPKMGTNIAAYKEAKADYEARVAEAQKAVDYWHAVKAERDKVLLEERRARKEKDKALYDDAVAQEEQRRAEMAQKAAEQEALGSNAVAPAIKEKWENAPKVDGGADEITLPNGEVVAGHYVLTESGAASASHQATNGFAETEGYPVDVNGETVNDRDYKRDAEAQQVTRGMAADYDSRALQSPVVVSGDGVVLSGNGRTMAGEIAALNGSDAKYNAYLRGHAGKFGFTTEQVEGFKHPRVVFVPDGEMPYTAETFAKFNQREQKSQSRTEMAVKLGKVVDDALFGRVMDVIGRHESLAEFYADDAATASVVKELADAGVIPQTEMAQLFDGGRLSESGQAMVEGVLVGKVFQGSPDAVRQITEVKSMRKAVMAALPEVVACHRLGGGYDLSKELAAAVDLVYKARKAGFKLGQHVSQHARQGNLFQLDDGATVADYNNAAVMMLADVMNDGRVTQLKKVLSFYNTQAADSAQGIGDMFAGGVKSKGQIINEVNELLNNGQEYDRRTPSVADGQGVGGEGGEQGDVAGPSHQGGAGSERGLSEAFDGLAAQLKTAEGDERKRVLGEMRDGIARFAEENGYPVPEFLLTREDFLAAVPEKDRAKYVEMLEKGMRMPAYYENKKVYYFVEGCDNFDKDVAETLAHEYTHADNAEFPENVNAIVYAVEDTHEVSQDELVDILEKLSDSTVYEEKAEQLEAEGKNANPMLADEVIAHSVGRMVVEGEQALDGITKNPTLQFFIKRAYKERENERQHNLYSNRNAERADKTVPSSGRNSSDNEAVAGGTPGDGQLGGSSEGDGHLEGTAERGRSAVSDGKEVAAPSEEGAKVGVTDGEKSSATGDVVPSGKGKTDNPRQQKAVGKSAQPPTREESILRDVVIEHMKGSGLDVIGTEDGQRVLDMANDDGAKEHRVYHGSGAEFDHFDHSHMGEGEGAQAYGWGTYVTEVEGIGRTYAESARKKPTYLYGGKEMPSDEFHDYVLGEIGYRNENMLNDFMYNLERHGVTRAKDILKKGDLAQYKNLFYQSIGDTRNYAEGKIKAARTLLSLKGIRIRKPKSHLYTVEIPEDNGKNYLDWNSETGKDLVSRLVSILRADKELKEAYEGRLSELNKELGKFAPRTLFSDTYVQLAELLGSDKKASQLLSSLGYAGIKYPAEFRSGGRKDGAQNYVIFNENDAEITDHVRFFKTKNGEAYGFTVGGKIYYDPRIANAETPVHEYAHLWASALKANNAEEWKNVVDLMKGTNVWEEVKKTYPELETDDEIADEVLATYSGRRGAERLREEMRKAAAEGDGVMGKAEAVSALQRVKRAIDKFWKAVADFLHIHYTSAEEVADRVMKDLLDGVDPRKFMGDKAQKEKMRYQFMGEKGAGENVRDAEDYTAFASRYGVSADMVKDYALGIKTGNLHKADFALAEIRRTMRVANRGMKLSEFGKLFRPVQKELAERYGDIEVLRQEYIDAEMRERGVMEAARKRAEEEAAKRKARADELRLLPEEELDRRYFEAVERGDDAAAREMLDEAARRKGYGDTESEYQGVGAWVAPLNPGYESDAARRADVEDNAPDVNVEDIALGYSLVDENYWHEPRKYMQTDATAVESVNAINDAMAAIRRGEKDVKVKVYRAVPTSVKEGKLRNGDWVTPSRAYAKMHGEHRLEGDYRIIEDEVPVNELWWDGNDSREWGFDDGKGYKYKNVENSRKLNDLVTRDDNGEIIAPSKRFDENVEDVRYREAEPRVLEGEEALAALDNIFRENAASVMPETVSSLERFKELFRSPIRTFLGELVKVKDEVWNKILRNNRQDITGTVLPTIENADFAIRDTDGSTLYVKRFESERSGNLYNIVVVNKHGEVEDYVSSVHIKRDGNLRNKIKNGAELFLPQERNTDGTLFRNNSTPAAKVGNNFETLQLSASEKAKQQAANDLARQMHVEGEVEVVASTDGLTGRQAKAKGWYDVRTGRVTIVLPNNKNAADVRETVFHEVVAHKGLRNLVGEEHFNTFLDNVYNNAEEGIKQTIDEMAEKKYNGDKRKATEEYMAHLAEDGEYVKPENQGFFAKVRNFLTDLLRKVGIKLGFKLTDNDLRYILWRSWKGLAERDGGSVFEKAEDVKMQHELGQTDEARSASGENGIMFREGSDELKDVVEKMKADVERLHEGELDDLRSGARAIGGRLSELNKAMRLQRAYDMSTVASVTELAKAMLKNGLLSEMSDYDVRRLLSVVNNVHGKGDIRPYVQKVVDMMVGNRLRNVSKAFDKLLAMRGKKVDARGVEVQGELDLAGQRMADVVWKGIGMSDDDVKYLYEDAQNRMMSANGAEAAAAATDYAGWQIVMHLGLLPYYNNLLAEYLASYTNTLQLIDCQYFTQCKILQISLAHNLHTPHAATWYKHGRRILQHRGAETSVAPTDCSTSLWRKIHRIHPNRLRGSGVGCVRCM